MEYHPNPNYPGLTTRTCLLFTGGHWIVSHKLKYDRFGHTSWQTPDNRTLLIGGAHSPNTTEILDDKSDSESHFPLKYPVGR